MLLLRGFRYYWVNARGYRLRPWRSPYLRWRMETYWGTPAAEVTAGRFWQRLWENRAELRRFLRWVERMDPLVGRNRRA